MMQIYEKIKNFIVLILFPSTEIIGKIQALDSNEIEKILPKSVSPPYPFIFSLFKYKNDNVKEVVWAIKYKGDCFLVVPFGEILFREISEFLQISKKEQESIYIVPIPLSKKRYTERGFNQSELISKALIKNDKQKKFIYSPQFLIRNKHTDPQTKLTMSRRRVNIKNCFSVPHKERPNIQNKIIILIDDVATTGSTLKEARRILLEAKANEVWAFTLAG